MKKTLILCSHYPLPENIGTNIRTMNFVRFFKQSGSVDIVYSFILPGAHVGNPVFSNEYHLAKESVKSFQERFKRWVNIKNRPLPISRYEYASEKKLLSLIKSNDYDYIVVRYLINTWSLFKLPVKYKKRTIIDYDDVVSGSLYESSMASANGSLRKIRLRWNQKFLINYEKKALNFGASLFCSKEDKLRVVGGNDRSNTFVVPNILHNESFENYNFGDGFENGNNLLFVGTLNYEPNIKGLKWFIDSIFASFKQKYSDSKLLVVGHFPDQEVKKLCEMNLGIELYANVSDIRKYYKHCRAVIVPLLAGGGTRIKILEAALANRPVLSTPIGAEGLQLKDGEDILLFNNSYDFFTKYAELFEKIRYSSLIRSAKSAILSKYSTQNFNESLEKVIDYFDIKNS